MLIPKNAGFVLAGFFLDITTETMSNTNHNKFMRLAVELAKRGQGKVAPNPMVGCVIVENNKIVSTGYHHCFGGAHAEIDALNKIKNIKSLRGCVMYVTLEPCSHYGKTPPCTDRIIKSGIKTVITAIKDPNPIVSGKGIRKLKQNNIRVVAGILPDECRELNKVFIKNVTAGLPYAVIKSAVSIDGKICANSGDSKWISSTKSREYVHELRAQSDAVLVGINTVINDNPELTAHGKGKNPVRIIIDPEMKISIRAKVIKNNDGITVLVVSESCSAEKQFPGNVRIMRVRKNRHGELDFRLLMKQLYDKYNIYSVLIEGGGETNAAAIRAGVVDEINLFVSPKLIGGREAKTFVEGPGIFNVSSALPVKFAGSELIGTDLLLKYRFE